MRQSANNISQIKGETGQDVSCEVNLVSPLTNCTGITSNYVWALQDNITIAAMVYVDVLYSICVNVMYGLHVIPGKLLLFMI